FPRGLARLRGFPEGEVHRIALALVDLDPRARLQILQVLPRQLAVPGEAVHLEVDVAVHRVGHALLDEALDERDHLRDVLGGLRLDVRRQHPERGHVDPVLGDVALRDVPGRDALLAGAPDDLVVDIGVVLDELHCVPAVSQIAPDDVEHDRAAAVADVADVVDRHAANVDSHARAPPPNQALLAPALGVERARGHRTSTLTTAIEAMPSPRPTKPRCSGLLAFTLTC